MPNHIPTNGSRLAEVLAEKGKTQRWLAMRLGVADSMVNRWVKQDVTPRHWYRQQIAKALKVGEGRIWPG